MVILKLKSPLEEGYPSTGRRRTEGNPEAVRLWLTRMRLGRNRIWEEKKSTASG